LYGTNIDQVLADETPTSMVWALADNQGTVRDLIDNNGNVVEHINYDSFGNLTSTPTFDFRYGYTGRERDDETGLEYYRARYYDSSVGRFISEDPIGFDAGDTNIYRYVGNNAVNAIDPDGLYGLVVGGSATGVGHRSITYVDGRGSYHTVNNIERVIRARITDSNISIIRDTTHAIVIYSASKVGTDTDNTRYSVPDINYVGDPSTRDNAGHIIGSQLGGNGRDLNNLFAQREFGYNKHNPSRLGGGRSSWRNFEDRVRTKIDEELIEVDPSDYCIIDPIRRGHRIAFLTVNLYYGQNGSLRPAGLSGFASYLNPFPSSAYALPDLVNVPNP
jgi:RHS repeat-associated protein